MLLVRGAKVFAPEPLGVCDLLLAGGAVVAMAPELPSMRGWPQLRVIDAKDLIVVPGLVDSLVHVSGGGGEGGFASRTRPLEAAQALSAGVTTVIGALGTDDSTRSHADLLACCRALANEGLSAFALTGSYHVPLRTLTGCLRDDLVLIPDLIGVGEVAIADHRGSQPSVGELARIATEARVGGMLSGKAGTVLIHVGDADDQLHLLDAVVEQHAVSRELFLPTHCNRSRRLFDAARRWMAAGGYADFTTSTTDGLIEAGEVPAVDALLALVDDPILVGRVTVSSDAQASLPQFDAEGRLQAMAVAEIGSLLDTLRRGWRERPDRFSEILAAATSTPADVWSLTRKGRVRVNADADLLLLDPASYAPRAVIAAGRYRLIG